MASPAEPGITDDQLAEMVAVADLPSLLAALAHITATPDLPGDGLFLDPTKHHETHGGWTPDQQAHARLLALRTLIDLRDAGWPAAPRPTADAVRPIMTWMTATETSDDYLALLLEELGDSADDLRAPSWTAAGVATGRPFRVAVVGAGMSGLLAAHRLRQAGIDIVVFEKNAEVGGTWLQNTYPGCRVDVASHLFCYSFAQRDDWPQHFSTQPELLAYFQRCADDFDVRRFIQFSTTVEAMRFDDESAMWEVSTVDDNGRPSTGTFHAVVNAHRPAEPAEATRHTRPHDVRRRGVPFGRVGPRRRSRRQARRRDRHRRQRSPVHPHHRRAGRAGTGVAAHSELVATHARLPPRCGRRPAVAVAARALLQPVVPLLVVLEVRRRDPSSGDGGSRVGRQGPVGQRRQ